MNILRAILTTSAVLGSALAVSADLDAAGLSGVFPGSACQVVSGTRAIRARGSIRNASTTADLVVDCPTLHPNDTSNGQSPLVNLFYYDDSATRSLSCTTHAEDMDSTDADADSGNSDGIDDREYRAILMQTGDIGGQNHRMAHIRCTIPPFPAGHEIGIVGYWVSFG